jgi:alpha-1,3-rhamnosyl/mannosyltransferase
VLERHGLTGRSYVLGVGTLEPRKNLPASSRPSPRLEPELRAEHELVLVGALGWDTDATLRALERHRGLVRDAGPRARGRPAPRLTAAPPVFAYPSLYEGFGLPVSRR